MGSRIRVTMVVNNMDVGGLEKVVLNLLSSLPKDRYEPSLACLKGPGKLYDQVKLPESDRLVLRTENLTNLGFAKFDIGTLSALRRFFRDKQIDIVHAHNFAPLIYAGLAARSLPKRPRMVYSEHNQVNSASPADLKKFAYYVRLADEVVAVSDNLHDVLLNKLRVKAKVRVIKNGIDDARFNGVTGDRVRAELGVGPDDVLIGTAVVLSKQKGITHLMKAAEDVIARCPNAKFVVAGDGPLRAELEAELASKNLGDRFRLLGYRSDIPELLSAYDIYVLPSLWEGLPLALLEAMRLGKFIVCTTVGGNPEVVDDGVHGFLVPPGEPKPLADQLVRAIEGADLRARAAKVNPERFHREFSLRAMTEGHERLFEELVARRRR
ncbi:MAG: glycosyltransferase [Polyangiaceae bacterium]